MTNTPSKFKYQGNGIAANGAEIYDVLHIASRKHIGLTYNSGRDGWVVWVRGEKETGYRTRNAAADRLLLVAACNPAAAAALPTDPFDGIAAVTA